MNGASRAWREASAKEAIGINRKHSSSDRKRLRTCETPFLKWSSCRSESVVEPIVTSAPSRPLTEMRGERWEMRVRAMGDQRQREMRGDTRGEKGEIWERPVG